MPSALHQALILILMLSAMCGALIDFMLQHTLNTSNPWLNVMLSLQHNLEPPQRQLLQNLQHQFYLQQQHAKMQALQQQGTSSGQGTTQGPTQLPGSQAHSLFGARFPFQGSHNVDSRMNLPSPNQGRPPSNPPFHNNNNNHPTTSGTPLKGPVLPSGYDPGRFATNLGTRPDLSSLPSHSSISGSHLPNIPHDLASAAAQELGTRPGEVTHADSLSKSINSNSSELNDIKALLSRPELATSIAEDLLKQFTDSSSSEKAISSGSDVQSSQETKNLASGSSVHSASVSAESSDVKVSSLEQLLDFEMAKCDEELSKFSSLPKLNVHMTGEQVIRACHGVGKSTFALMWKLMWQKR